MKTNINNNFFYMEQASDVVELVLPHEVDNPNNVYLYLEGLNVFASSKSIMAYDITIIISPG